MVAMVNFYVASAQNNGKVGLVLEKDEYSGFMMVTTVEPYTPAFKSAIQQDDIITAIDGKTTSNHSAEEVMQWLEGEAGTVVNVTVKDGKREYTTTLKRIPKAGSATTENVQSRSINAPSEVVQQEVGTCANVQQLLGQVLVKFENVKEREITAAQKWKSRVGLLGNATPIIYKEGEKYVFEQLIFQSKEKSAAAAAALMFVMELEGCQSCLKKYNHANKMEGDKEEDSWHNGAIMLKVIREKEGEDWNVKVKMSEVSGY